MNGDSTSLDAIRSRRLFVAWAALLVSVAAIGFIDMPGMMWAGDPVIWRAEARSILQGRLAIDASDVPVTAEPGQLAVVNPRNGRLYSKYGLVTSLMLIIPTAVDRMTGGLATPPFRPSLLIHNLWNVVLSVGLAAALMKLSGRYTSRIATRLIFVAAALYSTYLWYFLRAQSSEIHQTLFFALAFLFVVTFLDHPDQMWRLHLAWGCIGALVLTRVLYVLLIPILAGVLVMMLLRMPREDRRAVVLRLWPGLLIPPLLIGVILGTINFVKFGSPLLSGYHQWKPEMHMPIGRWSEGLLGLLVRPRFSIFLHFPLLIVALFGFRAFWRRFPNDALLVWGTAAVFILLIAKLPIWPGEFTYGPRYVLFFLPVLSVPFILVVDRLAAARPAVRWPVAAAIAGTVLYSTWLLVRVNQVDFHFHYFFLEALGPRWNGHFLNNHTGWVTDGVIRRCQTLDGLPWFEQLKREWPPQTVEELRVIVREYVENGNHYWW